MTPLIAGNWKMNGLLASRTEIDLLAAMIKDQGMPDCEIVICPPATLLFPAMKHVHDTPIQLGAQDCHWDLSGAHTGDISALMIKEAGCAYVIVGHSERRSGHGEHGERSQQVAAKAKTAIEQDIKPIICVGESLDEREAGKARIHVLDQVKKSLPRECPPDKVSIAYEPMWAIGTGKTATPDDIAEMHGWIREHLVERLGRAGKTMRILYGGSVNAENAKEILSTPNVNGVLVGGASLKVGLLPDHPGGWVGAQKTLAKSCFFGYKRARNSKHG